MWVPGRQAAGRARVQLGTHGRNPEGVMRWEENVFKATPAAEVGVSLCLLTNVFKNQANYSKGRFFLATCIIIKKHI